MELKHIKIRELKKADYNPRKIGKTEMDALKRSIERYGLVDPVIINKDHTIIGGHQRTEAARQLGHKEVPCVVLDLDADSEKELNIALNKISGKFNEQILADLLEDLKEKGRLAYTGFKEKELQRLQWKKGLKEKNKLIAQFIIPPFSVFDAKQGYWQQRKKEWLGYLEVTGGEGRGDNLISGGMEKLGAMAGGLTGTSIFDPVLTEAMYAWYSPEGGTIIDPFSGGVTRGAVASILDRNYIGADVSSQQIAANRAALKHLKEEKAKYHEVSGEKLYSHLPGQADLLFTCPPYYDLEIYDKNNPEDISAAKTYKEFLAKYEAILAPSYTHIKDGGYAIIVIGNVRDKDGNLLNLVGDTISIMQRAGYTFYNECILATAIGTAPVRASAHFSKNKKVVKTHQNVLFFTKGKEIAINPKLANLLLNGATATAHHDVLVFKK